MAAVGKETRYLLPAERITLAGLAIAAIAHGGFGLPLLMPGLGAILVFILFFFPSYIACALLYTRHRNTPPPPNHIIRTYLTFFVCCYLCYAMKHWSHLLHTDYYDDAYQRLDNWLAPLLAGQRYVNDLLRIPVSVEHYIFAFQGIFYAAFPVCFVGGSRRFNACSAAFVLLLITGGLSYSIAPALGPFIDWPREQWHPLFTLYRDSTLAFHQSHGAVYTPANFTFTLGAMPSMHVAIPLVLSWYMWKTHHAWGALGFLITLYCIMHAQFTGFHYFADILAGVALAVAAIILTTRFNPA